MRESSKVRRAVQVDLLFNVYDDGPSRRYVDCIETLSESSSEPCVGLIDRIRSCGRERIVFSIARDRRGRVAFRTASAGRLRFGVTSRNLRTVYPS